MSEPSSRIRVELNESKGILPCQADCQECNVARKDNISLAPAMAQSSPLSASQQLQLEVMVLRGRLGEVIGAMISRNCHCCDSQLTDGQIMEAGSICMVRYSSVLCTTLDEPSLMTKAASRPGETWQRRRSFNLKHGRSGYC